MTFNRLTLFLTGLAVLVGLYFLQRGVTYHRSEFTHGILICKNPEDAQYYEAEMELHYYIGMKEYVTETTQPTVLAYRPVTVRYLPDKPDRGRLYTMRDFWFVSALWLLLPTMLWGAFVFTLLNENGRLVVKMGRRKDENTTL